jgi:hypothetical protein
LGSAGTPDAVSSGIGINWISEGLFGLLGTVSKRETALARALGRALSKGATTVETNYRDTYGSLDARELRAFNSIRYSQDEVIDWVEDLPQLITLASFETELTRTLSYVLDDVGERAFAFIAGYFPAAVTQAFVGELNDDAAAWRAYHTWLFQSLATLPEQVRGQHAELVSLLGKIKETNSSIQQQAGAVATGHNKVSAHLEDLRADVRQLSAWIRHNLAQAVGGYYGPIEDFIHLYTGTQDAPEPFGGRNRELAELDAWLTGQGAKPYYFLTAEAGVGKSALLVRWLAHTRGNNEYEIVFMPISYRVNTQSKDAVFGTLANWLAKLHGQANIAGESGDGYQRIFSELLRRPLPNGKKLLLILDGLDEAEWDSHGGIFPIAPTAHLRILISARLKSHPTGEDWLRSLNWSHSHAELKQLSGLDLAGIQDVLAQMGNPLDQLANRDTVVQKLLEITTGDPLVLGLYVKDLQSRPNEAATLQSTDLEKIESGSGLAGYFEVWRKTQERLWQSSPSGANWASVEPFVNACAVALGPLSVVDVIRVSTLKSVGAVESAANSLRRFVYGMGTDVSGYRFTHPRLRNYFLERLRLDEHAYQQQVDCFIAYGRTIFDQLGRSQGKGSQHAYVVRHFGEHLEAAQAQDKDVYALICNAWRQAWSDLTGTTDGFLNDVDRAWRRAIALGASCSPSTARHRYCEGGLQKVNGR